MSKNRLLVGIVLAFLSWGCAQKVVPYSASEEMESLVPSKTNYDYLQAKAKIVLEENSGKITRGNLQVRAKKDSLIWFSLSPGLGVEAIRGLLSQDKIKLLNRLGGEDLDLSYAEFEQRYRINLSLTLVQNILWGDSPFEPSFEDRLVRVGKKFEVTQVRNKVRYFSQVDSRLGKVTSLSSTSINGAGSLLASFDDYQNLNGTIFPLEVLFKVSMGEVPNAQNIRIYISWTAVEPNVNPITFPFRF